MNNILFLTYPGVDMGMPDFRIGSIKTYLMPLAERLRIDAPEIDCRFLVGRHVRPFMARDPAFQSRRQDDFLTFDTLDVFPDRSFDDSVLSELYRDALSPEDETLVRAAFERALARFRPDAVISWEFPTTLLRRMFPEAVVLDLMPGTFMRPPYPKTVSVDPEGIYRASGLRTLMRDGPAPTDTESAAYEQIRASYENFFSEIDAKDRVLVALDAPRSLTDIILLPLQVSNYFGYRDNTRFGSQFDLLQSVLRRAPETTGVIATQYTGSLVQDLVLRPDNAAYLKRAFPNFLYDPVLDELNNVSQYIAPWADETVSVSSTVALQAHFFGRKVTSPSNSHLPYLADGIARLGAEGSAALLNSRYSISWARLSAEPKAFLRLLRHFRERHREGATVYEDWPLPLDANDYLQVSDFARAAQLFATLSGENTTLANSQIKSFRARIEAADIVSFDVFDTLLQRRVYHPADVFLLTPYQLVPGFEPAAAPTLSPQLYATLRKSAEQSLRRERDRELAAGKEVSEEILTKDIFLRLEEDLARLSNVPSSPERAAALCTLEQETEAKLLVPTVLGRNLFTHARTLGKRIIIVSDFCHDEAFVDARLKAAGYDGFELFVSSKERTKKHSGALFRLLTERLGVDPSRIVHFGDNPVGDMKMAQENGWGAEIVSLPKDALMIDLKERGLDVVKLRTSLALRTAITLFANRYRNSDITPAFPRSRKSVAAQPEEFGYLCLGPLVLSFAEWILTTARKKGSTQILLFARDCVLPYKAIRALQDRGKFNDISCYYIEVSRSALKGLDIRRPSDIYEVDLSDVSGVAKVADVLRRRFRIDTGEISETLLRRHDVTLEKRFRAVPTGAIYRLVFDHVSADWDRTSARLERRRDCFATYLSDLGVDTDAPSCLVDIGYRGTITRIVQTFLDAPTVPLFLATYSDALGRDPIADARCFLNRRLSRSNTDPFLRNNLIYETLLNEPVGSAALIDDFDTEPRPSKMAEAPPPNKHIATVGRMHRGTVRFVEDWAETFAASQQNPWFEPNILLELADAILSRPTHEEARLFQGLEFDNNFAGHAPRYILPPAGDTSDEEAIWKPGERALSASDDPAKTRRALIETGAFVDFEYETPIVCNDSFHGTILFGAGKRGTAKVGGETFPASWVFNEVVAFRTPRQDDEKRTMYLSYLENDHTTNEGFRVFQNGAELGCEIVPISVGRRALRFTARPAASIVVAHPSYRTSLKPEIDKRRFYWRFLDLDVLDE